MTRASEQTGPTVASIAARGLRDPHSLSGAEIKQVCASALTQAPPRRSLLDKIKIAVLGE